MSIDTQEVASKVIATTRRQFTGLLCGSGLVALTGCGGGGTETPAPAPAPTPTPVPVPTPVGISLLAGSTDSIGNLDGVGTAARFSRINGLAADKAGNVYAADGASYALRKVSPAGEVRTLAGDGRGLAMVDGTGSAARVCWPAGVAVDAAGIVYVVDLLDKGKSRLCAIRRVSPTGAVTTLAARFENDGQGSSGIAVDSAGNLYLTGLNVVRKISPSGEMMLLAGAEGVSGSVDGVGGAARFSQPKGIAVDSVGVVYVTDAGSGTVRRIDPAGAVTTLAGTPDDFGSLDGQGGAARFERPTGLALDAAGKLFVQDGYQVRQVSPGGLVTTLGRFLIGDGDGIAVDSAGSVFLTAMGGSAILKRDSAGVVTTLAGATTAYPARGFDDIDGQGASARFGSLSSLALDATGAVYVPAYRSLRKISAQGQVTTTRMDAEPQSTELTCVAADSAGNIHVGRRSVILDLNILNPSVTYLGGAVLRIDARGAVSTVWTSPTKTPSRMAVDRDGNVFVVDSQTALLTKLSASGAELGQWSFSVTPNHWAELALDHAGAVYLGVANAVVKLNAAGAMTTVAGLVGQPGWADGAGAAARFDDIRGLVFDAAGNLFVADAGNHMIRRITPAGMVTTVVGRTGAVGIALGDLLGSLYAPAGLAFDAGGVLHIASAGAVLKVKSS